MLIWHSSDWPCANNADEAVADLDQITFFIFKDSHVYVDKKSKQGCKDQESIQSSTTPDQDTNGKVTNKNGIAHFVV